MTKEKLLKELEELKTCKVCGEKGEFIGAKKFSGGKAAGGALLLGPLGALAGFRGSKKIKVGCKSCYSVQIVDPSKLQDKLKKLNAKSPEEKKIEMLNNIEENKQKIKEDWKNALNGEQRKKDLIEKIGEKKYYRDQKILKFVLMPMIAFSILLLIIGSIIEGV